MRRRTDIPAAAILLVAVLSPVSSMRAGDTAVPVGSFDGGELITFRADELTPIASAGVEFTQLPGEAPDGKGLRIATSEATDTAIVQAPPVAVEPGRRYRIQAVLTPVKATADVQLCVWGREHSELGGRPIAPYPRTSVSARAVQPHQVGQWTVRSLTFTSRAEARFVVAWLSVAGPPAEILVGSIRIIDIEQAGGSDRAALRPLLAQLQGEALERQSVLPRPLVFSRAQMKYGLGRNYMRRWIDRPLLVDRSTRVPGEHVTPHASYARVIDVVKQYGLDGLAFFPETKGRMGIFEMTARAQPGEGFSLLPEFTPSQAVEPKEELLRAALASEYSVRIDGKLLVTSYVASALTPAEWGELLDTLRARVGHDFLFLPALAAPVRFKPDFQAGIPIAPEAVEECKTYLRSYLDVCDGIYFHYAAALKHKDRTFDDEFYRELFIPLFKSVLAEPKYRGKYLGLSAYHSHYNADLSLGLQEDGTKTLRRSLAAALDAAPDIVIMPEWDEVNENTCIRPTVFNSFASQRILRYHTDGLKGLKPGPRPGDNTSVPNLVISYRKILTLGEVLAVEVLNVPDATASGPLEIRLELTDRTGVVVRRLDPAELDSAELVDHTFRVPTETLAAYRALCPRLIVGGYGRQRALTVDRGLHHVQLRATWNWDYKYVKQPLRDLIVPREAAFGFVRGSAEAAQVVTVAGRFACDEPIALAEVLEDDDVVYAVDPKDEFGRGSPEKVLIWVELRSLRQVQLKGALSVENAPCEWRMSGVPLHTPPPETAVRGNRLELDTPAFCHLRWALAIVPRTAAAEAVVVAEFDLATLRVPVAQVLERGVYSRTYQDGLSITVCDYWKQPDMPFHLGSMGTSFQARVRPELPTAQLHMRITTTSGRTFRSAPLLLLASDGGGETTLPVYSDSRGGRVPVLVDDVRVPDCVYDFSDRYGAILHTRAGRPFWGTLGAYVDTSTGRGGNGGGASATLFRFGTQAYPAGARETAPSWVTHDGASCLQFDGVGNYLLLPREALPRRGPFTLSFEIRPDTVHKAQVLFAHRTARIASLALHLRDGKLGGVYYTQDYGAFPLDSELTVKAGEWSRVELSYDLRNMRLQVNDAHQVFPCRGPGLNIGLCVFGGYGTGGKKDGLPGNEWWFGGLLRRLRIRHRPTEE